MSTVHAAAHTALQIVNKSNGLQHKL